MKAYTDLEQSKRLSEILPIESADMCWTNHCYGSIRSSMTVSSKTIEEYKKLLMQFADLTDIDVFYPCWSLSALLNILPETIEDEWGEYELSIDMIYKKPEYIRLGDCHHSDFPSWDWDKEELLDNIVESVIWLYNNGYLRNKGYTNLEYRKENEL